MAAEHNNRKVGLKTFCEAENLRTLPAWNIQVENYHVGAEAIELQISLGGAGSLGDDVSLRCEETTDAGADDGVGIDDEDSVQALTIPSGHEESREGLQNYRKLRAESPPPAEPPIAQVCEAAKIKADRQLLLSVILYAVQERGCDVGHEKMFVGAVAILQPHQVFQIRLIVCRRGWNSVGKFRTLRR
jgi:hypothetical protein